MPHKKRPVIILGDGRAGACTAMYPLQCGVKPEPLSSDVISLDRTSRFD
jgi:hypothetical protein